MTERTERAGAEPLPAPSPLDLAALEAGRTRLDGILRSLGRTLIAYSGGVDSTLLLVQASRVLGADALGVIADSPSLPRAELSDALSAAREAGAAVRVVRTSELGRPAYRANGADRCFHCKTELFETLGRIARDEGWASIAYGAVTDDLGDVRPGMDAARDLGIRAPLLEAGLGKREVRAMARRLGLRAWDKPQAACLASRIPHGTEVTGERLLRVERAEGWLRGEYGLRVLRVRISGDGARIEVAPPDIGRLSRPEELARISFELKSLGFSFVTVDLEGYRRRPAGPEPGREGF
jgi:uncharacterized protein